jgi:hypothetical protein
MPVLCFPCTVHRLARNSRPSRRRIWIKGHDFRTLAVAATAQLGVGKEQCDYGIAWPDPGKASVLLEIAHPDCEALVGPMARPLPPAAMRLDEHLSLDGLPSELGFASPSGCLTRLGSGGFGPYEVSLPTRRSGSGLRFRRRARLTRPMRSIEDAARRPRCSSSNAPGIKAFI